MIDPNTPTIGTECAELLEDIFSGTTVTDYETGFETTN